MLHARYGGDLRKRIKMHEDYSTGMTGLCHRAACD